MQKGGGMMLSDMTKASWRRHGRSVVPDLLFEDVCAARVQDVLPYLEDPEQVGAETPLHRVTVFLTYRCNLDCPYCKTIAHNAQELLDFPQKASSFDYAAFEQLLGSLEASPIRHLHFTGGEATLVPDLPDMVSRAKARGVAHISITSNGTLPQRIYRTLVEHGIDEIRISLDAHNPALGMALTQRQKAWHTAVENIQALAALRDAGHAFFLIANTVISTINRKHTAEIARFLMTLGVDDLKLITVVQEKETLGAFPEAHEILQELEALLSAYPVEAFPLLRRKLRTVFATEAIGLVEVTTPANTAWRCYIPLTERTVDGVYYYPCSVYLREGGAPLGAISEPAALQREKIAHFVRHGNCLSDPICQRYCLHCTRGYNVVANETRLKNDCGIEHPRN
jgi:molybdenum cofactor biosynthesis enzyme MoaA